MFPRIQDYSHLEVDTICHLGNGENLNQVAGGLILENSKPFGREACHISKAGGMIAT